MTRPLPRTGFNSPRLVRLLADLANGAVAESKQSFAERLGQWLDFTDAIALSGALNASAGGTAAASARADGAVAEDLARVRGALAESIAADGVALPGKARIRLPLPAAGATLDSAVAGAGAGDFLPYHRYYAAHQRDMEAAIGPLRGRVREALAGRSPALAQLAALDAALEAALGERERSLLATVPVLLEKRFAQRRRAYRQALDEARQADDPEQWMQPGGWLAAFRADLQHVLLAELEVRLQPVAGLVDALSGAHPPGNGDAVSAKTRGAPSFS